MKGSAAASILIVIFVAIPGSGHTPVRYVHGLSQGSETPIYEELDTLGRHLATHGADAEGLIVRTRGISACQSCSQDKVKCSGGIPCARCLSKNRRCLNRSRNRNSNSRLSYSNYATNQALNLSPDSPDVPTSNIDDSINGSSSTPRLPSGPNSSGLSTNALEEPPSNHAAFFPVIDDLPPFALDMSADFPWTLEYSDFFSEGHFGPHYSHLEPVGHLEYSLFPSASPAEVITNGGTDKAPFQGAVKARDLQSEGERPSPTFRTQELRQLDSSTPVQTLAMQATDEDITMAENFCHVNVPFNTVYLSIFAFYSHQQDARFREAPFPTLPIFDSFIQLYYEYFDDQLPFIHPSLLEEADTPWILTLAVASIGSQYSNIAKREAYVSMLTDLLTISLPLDIMSSICKFDEPGLLH
ncbi:uncharacterized protein N7484_000251 [Penicillium longicatenatum]|uniref:uncharacterized protein n=1 Tax=Penicillium longicatenatum TaxID=1561947 RepID=UPI0025466E60|nr:uncharacterized protein N7484_000251 [Penicillium longicatenatum]KAJ5660879.1 hypothetical protein N7484_000251 [Penicillium longicatenatum]